METERTLSRDPRNAPSPDEPHRAFDVVAGCYSQRRHYPPSLVTWLLAHVETRPGAVFVDIGCGPGTLTRALGSCGVISLGVDPSEAMLRELRRSEDSSEPRGPDLHPSAAVRGVGELLPLRTGSIDAAAFSQSLHWMDARRAVAEVRRVLRPSGMLFACWQAWMDGDAPLEQVWGDAWRRILGRVPRRAGRPAMDAAEDLVGVAAEHRFEELQRFEFPPERQVAFLMSRAACGGLEADVRERLSRTFTRGCEQLGTSEYELVVHARAWSRDRLPRQGSPRPAT